MHRFLTLRRLPKRRRGGLQRALLTQGWGMIRHLWQQSELTHLVHPQCHLTGRALVTFPQKTEGGLLPKRAKGGGGHAELRLLKF